MSKAAVIKKPVEQELIAFNEYFKAVLHSDAKLLNMVSNYVLRSKGKQLRPVMVFLSAKLHGAVTDSSNVAATLIELMHTASLIHDDVVDDSMQRRGLFSVNALWKNKAAVLIGDFFLSKGLLVAIDNNAFQILRYFSNAVKEMSEGELIQIEKARFLSVDFDSYYSIIKKKTASLFVAALTSGACSAGATDDQIKNMEIFGENLGMAFQIKDDIFDYQKSNLIGKPTGNDLKEQKVTLPLLYVLSKLSAKEQNILRRKLKKQSNNSKVIQGIIDLTVKNGGLDYAERKMNEFAQKALAAISAYPESEVKTAMKELVNYVTERKK